MARVNRTGKFLEDKKMAKKIGTVEEALQDLRDGKVILVIDDPDRENEGDLIMKCKFVIRIKTMLKRNTNRQMFCKKCVVHKSSF